MRYVTHWEVWRAGGESALIGGEKDSERLVIDPSGGANQIRVRAYNERLVMSLVRRHKALSKAEIARRTGLSAQTVSVIMRALEADGLLMRGEPVRGKVGQPSVPMLLNPDGAYSLGLKIGRRSAELILMDFSGRARRQFHSSFRYPKLQQVLTFLRDSLQTISSELDKSQIERICGLGVAIPGEIWNWAETLGAPTEELEEWRDADIEFLLGKASGLPIFMENDATAACAAELVLGQGPRFTDFAYFFVGMFVGGGIVLNHTLYPGRTGNAAAFGSMPVAESSQDTPGQLIEHASIVNLEKMIQAAGRDATSIWNPPEEWEDFGEIIDRWILHTADHLALAALTACTVIDFEAIIIDGGFSPQIRQRLVEAVRSAFSKLNLKGVNTPFIEEGMVGSGARAIGAASLPLFSRYLTDQAVLFKEMMNA